MQLGTVAIAQLTVEKSAGQCMNFTQLKTNKQTKKARRQYSFIDIIDK